jgi:hypothetical protein
MQYTGKLSSTSRPISPGVEHVYHAKVYIKMSQKKYIFGYGSLASAQDIFTTLGREVTLICPVELVGWVRDWDIVLKNKANRRQFRVVPTNEIPDHVAALNIRRPRTNELPTNPNGVLFEVTDDDLLAMDMRESHYDRVEVTEDIVGDFEGQVYAYVGRSQHTGLLADGTIIPESYYQLVAETFLSLGPGMQEKFFSSTLTSPLPIRPTVLQ